MGMPDMYMQPDAVSGITQRLDGEAQRLGDAWTSGENWIFANESGIGGDRLGQAFRGVYTPAATDAIDAADKTVTALADDAAVGQACVGDYHQGDQRARKAIPDPGTPLTPGRPF